MMTQHVALVRKISDREAGQTPGRDHVFTIDATAVPHHHTCSLHERFDPVYELVTTCTEQQKDSGHVLPRNHDSNFIEGHESTPTDGYKSILVWTVPGPGSIC